MIDARVSIYPVPGRGVTSLGRMFPDIAAAESWLADAIPRREALAGRTLTATELVVGVNHVEDRNSSERSRDANWIMPMVEVASDVDPFAHIKEAQHGKQSFDGPRNRKELAKAAREQYEKRTGVQIDSPEVLAAREYALDLYERILFDASQPMSAVVRAEQIKNTAWTDGSDLGAFTQMSSDFADAQQDRYLSARVAAEQERAAAESKIAAMPKPVAAFSTTPGVTPGDKVLKLRDADGNKIIRVVRDDIVKQQWAEADAPPEIVAAAT